MNNDLSVQMIDNYYQNKRDIENNINANYLPDLIYGGTGDDIIYVSNAGGLTFGDGTDSVHDNIYTKLLNMIGIDSNANFYEVFYTLTQKSFTYLEEFAEKVEQFDKETDGNDYIYPGSYNVIFGNGGNDNIQTTNYINKNVIVFGCSGDDTIGNALYAFGGTGDDVIAHSKYAFGGYGDDIINCSSSTKYVSAGGGNDIIMDPYEYKNLYTTQIYGGDGIDIITLSQEYSLLNLSYNLKYDVVNDVEILMKYNGKNASGLYDFNVNLHNVETVKDYLFSESYHQIILNEDDNTITLGSGWKYVAGSETGEGDYRTNTYIYEIGDGHNLTLETTLDVTNIAKTAPVWDPHRPIFSGHEANVAGQLDYSFGADDGSGKKLSVLINGEEFTLTPGKENTVAGQYGSLTIDENGLFSYKALANAEGTDEFVFRIEDADGTVVDTDVDGNPLKILVDVSKPEGPEDTAISYGEPDSGESLNIDLGFTGYTITDINMDSDVATLEQDANGNWSYVLKDNLDHSDSRSHTDAVTMTVEDRFGNTYDVTQNVNIWDDAPGTANIRVNLINKFEHSGGSSEIAGADHIFYNFGADNEKGQTSIIYHGADGDIEIIEGEETTIRGRYGNMVLTLNAGDIVYYYKADKEAEVWDKFDFTYTDSDGSQGNNSIEIKTRFGIDI